jgi:PAS domain S-box-containing protein
MFDPVKIGQDAETFFGKITELSPVLLYIFDLKAMQNVWVNQPIGGMLGYSPDQVAAMGDRMLEDLMHPDDWALYPAHYERLLALKPGQSEQFEYRMQRPDGTWRWLLSEEVPYQMGVNGATRSILGCAVDISARKEAELREELMRRELQHRIKNLFAVAGSVARMSARDAATAEEAGAKAAQRIEALSWSSMLSLEGTQQRVVLSDLIDKAVAAYAESGQVAVACDAITLHYADADSVGMILHELLTNAVKYGALSGPEGRLAITARATAGGLQLVWDEDISGCEVRAPAEPPTRRGFGQRLITQSAQALGGEVRLEWRSEGLRLTLSCPLTDPAAGARA